MNSRAKLLSKYFILANLTIFSLCAHTFSQVNERVSVNKTTKRISIVKATYEQPFGKEPIDRNTVFEFPDFKLRYIKAVPLTAEELKRKQEALNDGIDGGDTMLAPSDVFRVEKHNNEQVTELKMRKLPYARAPFTVGQKKFTLKNSQSQAGMWIIKQDE